MHNRIKMFYLRWARRVTALVLSFGFIIGGATLGWSQPEQGRERNKTWTDIKGEVYGAKPSNRGPIGGGEGYARGVRIVNGDYRVSTAAELIQALEEAESGQTVFVEGTAKIDLTVRVQAEDFVLNVPGGVTLASDRGVNGSPGGLIYSDAFATSPLVSVGGPNVRITGLRVRGPDPKLRMDLHRRSFRTQNPGGRDLYYNFPTSTGIRTHYANLEVDNCELSGWSYAGVSLQESKEHSIHHNHIHHNRRHGLGYGVHVGQASALIEYNLFDYNRHSIAGSGQPGSSYEARHNVVGTHANSHLFDMHGGRDRDDGTDIAGTSIKIHHNTFKALHEDAVVIRGVPEQEALVHHNWFYLPEPGDEVVRADGNTRVFSNVYGHFASKLPSEQDAYVFED